MGVITASTLAMGAKVAAGAAQTGLSFAQYNKQRKLQLEAQDEARKAIESAKKRLEVNYMDALSVIKEPYELQREALISSGAQAIEAARESQRGVAGTAGRVQMAMNEGQAGIRRDMGREMMELERLSAAEDARLAGSLSAIEREEAAGAQLARREALRMQQAAMQQGLSGLTRTLGSAIELGTEIDETTARNRPKIDTGGLDGTDFSATSISGQSPASLDISASQPFDVNMQAPMSYGGFRLPTEYSGMSFAEIANMLNVPQDMDISQLVKLIYQ